MYYLEVPNHSTGPRSPLRDMKVNKFQLCVLWVSIYDILLQCKMDYWTNGSLSQLNKYLIG